MAPASEPILDHRWGPKWYLPWAVFGPPPGGKLDMLRGPFLVRPSRQVLDLFGTRFGPISGDDSGSRGAGPVVGKSRCETWPTALTRKGSHRASEMVPGPCPKTVPRNVRFLDPDLVQKQGTQNPQTWPTRWSKIRPAKVPILVPRGCPKSRQGGSRFAAPRGSKIRPPGRTIFGTRDGPESG